MEVYEIHPFVRYAAAGKAESRNVCWLAAGDCRLFYIVRGNGSFETAKMSVKLSPGGVIYLPSDCAFLLRGSGTGISYFCVHFDFTPSHAHIRTPLELVTKEDYLKLKITEHAPAGDFEKPLFSAAVPDAGEKIAAIQSEFEKAEKYSPAVCSALLTELLVDLVRNREEKEDDAKRLVGRVIAYFKEHMSENPDNETVARAFDYHPYYLSSIFKEKTGTTMHRYFLKLKCEAAAELLLTSDFSVGEIAESCGFENVSHFSSAFTRYTGASPSQFRQKKFQ